MTRRKKLVLAALVLLGGLLALFATGFLRVSTDGPGRMDERGAEVWKLNNGTAAAIERTYFTAIARSGTFHVEWSCKACEPDNLSTHAEKMKLVRPVLRHALVRGIASRTRITKFGAGDVKLKRLRAVVGLPPPAKPLEVIVSDFNELFRWDWAIDGQSYHILGAGYYFDMDANEWTFTLRWHDRNLCPLLLSPSGQTIITDEAAGRLAMPVMERAARLKLWEIVPMVDEAGARPPPATIDYIGVQLGCPRPDCADSPDCPAKGYRVPRRMADIHVSSP